MSSATTLGQRIAADLDEAQLLIPYVQHRSYSDTMKLVAELIDSEVKELVEDKRRLNWAIAHPDQFNSINMADPSETLEAAKVRVREAIRAALGTDREQEEK